MTLGARFVAYDPAGARRGILPYPLAGQARDVFNDLGAGSIDYLADAQNSPLLEGLCEVAAEVNDGRGWSEVGARMMRLKRGASVIEETRTRRYTLHSYGTQLAKMRMLREETVDDSGDRQMTGTVGAIIKTLFDEAKARAAVTAFTYDFTATADSNGVAWGGSLPPVNLRFGDDLLSLLRMLAENGACDWKIQGRTLRMFKPDTLGVDKSATIQLFNGVDITEAPDDEDATEMAGRVGVIGDEGRTYEAISPSVNPWGLWEETVNAAGVKDIGGLQFIGEAEQRRRSAPRLQMTRKIGTVHVRHLPVLDYNVGDTITAPNDKGEPSAVRVRELQLDVGADGVSVNATLNDRILERDIRDRRAWQGMLGGAGASAGGSGNPTGGDKRQPGAPTGFVCSSAHLWSPTGEPFAVLDSGFVPVSAGVDGKPITVSKHEMYGRRNVVGEPWRKVTDTTAGVSRITYSPLPAGEDWQFKLRAVSQAGIAGEFTAPVSLTLAADTTPPDQPSKPTATARLGQIILECDGKTVTGDPQSIDFAHFDVLMSMTATGDAVVVGQMGLSGAKSTFVAPEQPYNQQRWFSLVGVDTSGNRSVESARVVVMAKPLVDTDLIGRVIDGANMKLDSISGDVIKAKAIDAAQISDAVNNAIATAQAEAVAAGSQASGAAATANAAATAADQANANALAAAKEAGYALSTADGKNRIIPSVTEPAGDTRNLVTNPSFEIQSGTVEVRRNRAVRPYPGNGGWISNNAAAYPVTQDSVFLTPAGRPSARTDRLAASPSGAVSSLHSVGQAAYSQSGRTPVTAGETLVGSVVSAASWENHRVAVVFYWFDNAGAEIVASRTNVSTDTTVPANTWTTVPYSVVVPAGAVRLTIMATHQLKTGVTVGGEKAWLGDVAIGSPIYFDGGFSPDPDLPPSWTGAAGESESILSGQLPTGIGAVPAGVSRFTSTQWAKSGNRSLRITPNGVVASYTSRAVSGLTPGKVYTALATVRLEAAQVGTLESRARALYITGGGMPATTSTPAPNTPGEHVVRVQFTPGASTATVFMFNGSAGSDIWWDDLAVVEGAYDGPFMQRFSQGDQWWVLDSAGAKITGVKVWNGGAFVPYQMVADSVLVAGSVTANTIAANAVTVLKIEANAVVAEKIAANAVVAEKIAANAVTAAKIEAGAVTAGKIAAGAVTAGKIAAGAVSADEIAANAVTAAKIEANAVTAGKIAANAVEAGKIAANAVTADKINAGAVTAAKVAAEAITGEKIAGDAIDGKTITGALIRSAAIGERTEMSGSGFRALDSAARELVKIGYGIPTGMAVRNPATGALVPLSDAAFGAVSVARSDSVAYSVACNTTPAASGGPGYWNAWTRHVTDTCEITFTAVSDRYIVQFGQTWASSYVAGNDVRIMVAPQVNGVRVTSANGPYFADCVMNSSSSVVEARMGSATGGIPIATTPGASYTINLVFRSIGWGSGSVGCSVAARFIVATPVFN